MVTTHCDYDGRIKNDGYMNSDRNNFLKWGNYVKLWPSTFRRRFNA
jgi:hypothetical protein